MRRLAGVLEEAENGGGDRNAHASTRASHLPESRATVRMVETVFSGPGTAPVVASVYSSEVGRR